MIYFDLPARRRVLETLPRQAGAGGYLLLGHSESLINVTADFELVHLQERHRLSTAERAGDPRWRRASSACW